MIGISMSMEIKKGILLCNSSKFLPCFNYMHWLQYFEFMSCGVKEFSMSPQKWSIHNCHSYFYCKWTFSNIIFSCCKYYLKSNWKLYQFKSILQETKDQILKRGISTSRSRRLYTSAKKFSNASLYIIYQNEFELYASSECKFSTHETKWWCKQVLSFLHLFFDTWMTTKT